MLNNITEDPNQRGSLNLELTQGGNLEEWIELIPGSNPVVGRDGRSWKNDHPDAIVQAFNSDGRDIVIDVNHSTEILAPEGKPSPAVGWIKALQQRGVSVWGRVFWNESGKKAVINREYRYISPVFLYQKVTDQIVKILSVALTNRPNLALKALNQVIPRPNYDLALQGYEAQRIAAIFGNTAEDIEKYGR